MKALVQTNIKKLEYLDFDMPIAKAQEALIKIEASGICGSDMHAFLGHDERRPVPLILGHEAAGVICQGPQTGRRVTINPLVTCGECAACQAGKNNLCAKRQIISMPPREGAFAEFVAIPVQNLVTVPDDVSFQKAALCEPLACGWHGARLAKEHFGGDLSNKKCLVLGGGAIGFGAALCLRALARGAGSGQLPEICIGEVNQDRRAHLKQIENFDVFDPAISCQSDFDIVIDGVGFSATRKTACEAVLPGGVIIHIGLGDSQEGLDVRRMTLQEITFKGTYTYTPQDFIDTAKAIFDGSLGALDWMEPRKLSNGQAAFDDLLAGKVSAPKIILHP